MTLTPEMIAEGWLPHDGGPCPVEIEMFQSLLDRYSENGGTISIPDDWPALLKIIRKHNAEQEQRARIEGYNEGIEAGAKVAETTEALGPASPFVKVAVGYIADEIRALAKPMKGQTDG